MWLIISHIVAGILGAFIVWVYFELRDIEIKEISDSDAEFISRKLKLFEEKKKK